MRMGLSYPRMRQWIAFLTGCVAAGVLWTSRAEAQSEEELARGRQLFAEALNDEEHERFAAALEKYRRVLAVRDTANVRFRMGAALEGLGKLARAVEAYREAVRLAGTSAGDGEVVRTARTRMAALEPRLGHLTIRLSQPGAEVAIDGQRVPSLDDVPMDPGAHRVTAEAPGTRPFRSEITLSEGGRLELPIALEAAPPPPPREPQATSTRTTLGWVSAVTGGALLAGGVVVLAIRSGTIADLEESCPGGACPAERETELRAMRDRALVEGPVAIALLATGAAALGTGIVLLSLRSSGGSSASLVPNATGGGGGLSLRARF